MRENNQKRFDEISANEYFKSNDQARNCIRHIDDFPDALGFDEESSGFMVFHKCHSVSALHDELPVCLILKKLGFGVILLDETVGLLVPDALILDRQFDIKRLSKAKNLQRAIREHFRGTARKADNILLHVDQPIQPNLLRSYIFHGVQNYPSIRGVWIVFRQKLWRLDRKIILKGQFQLD